MKLKYILISGAILLTSSGCLWPFGSNRSSVSGSVPAPAILVEILQPKILANGGKLVFIPFTAGADAEAGQQMDRLSLMIVKGASDAFQEGPSSIQVIDQGDPDAADMILEGHIEEFRSVRSRKPIGLGKIPGVVVIKAEVRARHTNEVLALISSRREFRDNRKVESLALDVGRQIAEQLIQQESRP
jgi:hypothetical protein